jgi:hypothetical protein
MVTRLQTLLENHNSLGSLSLDVSFIVIVVNVVYVVVVTTISTGKAPPPSPFPGGANCSLVSPQHTFEHLCSMNTKNGLGLPPSLPLPRDNDGDSNGNEDNNSLAIASLTSDACVTGNGGDGGLGNCLCQPPCLQKTRSMNMTMTMKHYFTRNGMGLDGRVVGRSPFFN